MKRAWLVVAALGAGCTSSQPLYGDVIVYWDFERHVLGPTPGVQPYDTQIDWPGNVSGPCPQSGVDTVDVTFPDGTPVDPSSLNLPCIFYNAASNTGEQGIYIPGLQAGPYTFLVTGYRNGVTNPLYQGSVTVNVIGGAIGGAAPAYNVTASGIPDDLDIYAGFLDATGSTQVATTCAQANVATLTYTLVDGAGTVVDAGTTYCTDPAGLSYQTALGQGIDRDDYSMRMQAFPPGATAATPPDFDSATPNTVPACVAQTFPHYGYDVGPNAWSLGLYDVTSVLPANICP